MIQHIAHEEFSEKATNKMARLKNRSQLDLLDFTRVMSGF